jgi:hypothetical protein
MIEYPERLGMIYGVFSLMLIIGMPVLINRLLNIRYPKAIFMLLASCLIFMAVDQLIHSLIFDITIQIDPLDNAIEVLVPIYAFAIALVIDVIVMSWQKISRQKAAKT